MSQPPTGYGYGPPSPGVTRPGELLDRFLARLIDLAILWVVGFLIGAVFVVGILLGGDASPIGIGANYLSAAVMSLLYAALYLGYFAFLESSRGQTLGKMAMKLRVVGPDGVGKPTTEQAIRRNIFMAANLLGLLPVLGGFLSLAAFIAAVAMIAVGINTDTANRQAWHDRFAGGTRVLKLA